MVYGIVFFFLVRIIEIIDEREYRIQILLVYSLNFYPILSCTYDYSG